MDQARTRYIFGQIQLRFNTQCPFRIGTISCISKNISPCWIFFFFFKCMLHELPGWHSYWTWGWNNSEKLHVSNALRYCSNSRWEVKKCDYTFVQLFEKMKSLKTLLFSLHFLPITMSAWDSFYRKALVRSKMRFFSLCAMVMWITNLSPLLFIFSELSLLSHCFTLTDCSSPIWSLQPRASICWWHTVRSHCIPRWTIPVHVVWNHTSN